MRKSVIAWVARALAILVGCFVAITAFTFAQDRDWLSFVGVASEGHDSQVIQAIERTQEVSLLSLDIQGLKEERRNAQVFGKAIPGTGSTVFLQYNFKAKLGIDGSEVTVTKTGENAYRISVPEFIFIGYDEPTFKVATEDGGILSWVTPDIDKVEMINEILNAEAQQEYIDKNDAVLREQVQQFYDALISSINPQIDTTFEFRPADES